MSCSCFKFKSTHTLTMQTHDTMQEFRQYTSPQLQSMQESSCRLLCIHSSIINASQLFARTVVADSALSHEFELRSARSIRPRRPLAGPLRALLRVAVRSLNNICMLLLTYATCRRNACIMTDLLLKLYSTHTCCDYATCMRSAMSPLLCLLCVVWPASAPHLHRPSSCPSSRRLG
jgi:hypothetical protein